MPMRPVLAAALMVLMLTSEAAAAASPRTTLEDFFQRAWAVLARAKDPTQARREIRALVRGVVDVRTAAREALGRTWTRRTGAERAEFERVFTSVFERAYLGMMEARLRGDRPPAVHFTGQAAGERAAVVNTRIEARTGEDVRLDYVMVRSGDDWRIHDVVMDGLSVVENYRAQFARVLRESSYDELMRRLRAAAGDEADEAVFAPSESASGTEVAVAYFETGRTDLAPAAREGLERAVQWLKADDRARVVVEGSSDQRGDPALNEALAERRAQAIRDYLVARGIDGDRITVATYRDRQPACEPPSPQCWAESRRAVVRATR
jgi:phospholipid transport system substrate-binding protein